MRLPSIMGGRRMKRCTKIVCTLGPAVDSKEAIRDLVRAGMNVARINCSHGDWETRSRLIAWVREASPSLGPIAVLADLQGPKFRIGPLPSGDLEVVVGEKLIIGRDPAHTLHVPDPVVWAGLAVGDRVLLGDGNVQLKIVGSGQDVFEAKALTGGAIKSKQGLTVVGKSFEVPGITEKDREDVAQACKLGVDFIALSYVRNASDMRELRRLVDSHEPEVRLCAKIETRDAVRSIDEILQLSDVIMVARGDLGLQMDLTEVPPAQKRIIRKCNHAGKPVIVATQMLESMLENPRPTRAEASDVANAILDGADAVMLSAETATGKYPVEAVKTMAAIAVKTEDLFDHEAWMDLSPASSQSSVTEAVASSTVRMGALLKVDSFLAASTSGLTPRMISKYRPHAPIFCATWSPYTHRHLAMVWGVTALQVPLAPYVADVVNHAIDLLLRDKAVKVGDQIVATAGYPPGAPGHTNLIMVTDVR